MTGEAWGYGVLVVRQDDLRIGHVVGGEVYAEDIAPLLVDAANHMDRELARLRDTPHADRLWWFEPDNVTAVEL